MNIIIKQINSIFFPYLIVCDKTVECVESVKNQTVKRTLIGCLEENRKENQSKYRSRVLEKTSKVVVAESGDSWVDEKEIEPIWELALKIHL